MVSLADEEPEAPGASGRVARPPGAGQFCRLLGGRRGSHQAPREACVLTWIFAPFPGAKKPVASAVLGHSWGWETSTKGARGDGKGDLEDTLELRREWGAPNPGVLGVFY